MCYDSKGFVAARGETSSFTMVPRQFDKAHRQKTNAEKRKVGLLVGVLRGNPVSLKFFPRWQLHPSCFTELDTVL